MCRWTEPISSLTSQARSANGLVGEGYGAQANELAKPEVMRLEIWVGTIHDHMHGMLKCQNASEPSLLLCRRENNGFDPNVSIVSKCASTQLPLCSRVVLTACIPTEHTPAFQYCLA